MVTSAFFGDTEVRMLHWLHEKASFRKVLGGPNNTVSTSLCSFAFLVHYIGPASGTVYAIGDGIPNTPKKLVHNLSFIMERMSSIWSTDENVISFVVGI